MSRKLCFISVQCAGIRVAQTLEHTEVVIPTHAHTCAQTNIDTYERNYIRRDTHSIRIRIHDADAIRRKWHMSRSPGCLLIQLRMCLRMRQKLKRIHIRRGIARQLWLNSFHYSVDSRCCCYVHVCVHECKMCKCN